MVAMEWKREPKARFRLPRRKVLEGKHGIATKILQHKIKMGRTEANNGGDEYSDDAYNILRKEHGYSINRNHKKPRPIWRN